MHSGRVDVSEASRTRRRAGHTASRRLWGLRVGVLVAVLVAVAVEWLAAVEFSDGALLVVPLLVLGVFDSRRWVAGAVLLAVAARFICVAGDHADASAAGVDCISYLLAGVAGQFLQSLLPSDAKGGTPAGRTSLWDALTRREREVIDLVLQGYTSKEVGKRLFISGRTVERHLEKAYAKLGIHGRGALTSMFRATAGPAPEVSSRQPV